jgi:hypothetical protein
MQKKLLAIWSTFVLILATYTAIEVPISVILHFDMLLWLTYFNLFVSVIFFIDMIISFNFHRKTKDGSFTKYLRGQFIIEILCIAPFDLLFVFFDLPPEFKILSFIRILRILRLAKLSGFVEKWGRGQFTNPAIMRIFYFLYWIFLILHWVSCGWILIHGKETQVVNGVPVFIDNTTTYIRAIYWGMTTLTTIGYGDIVPSTNTETIYVVAIQFLGAGMYGYIIGNIANLLSNVDQAKAHFREKIEKVNTFMRYKKLPYELQEKVVQYYSYLWENKRGYDEESIMSDLPSSLKMKVALYLNKDMLDKIPLLMGASDSLLNELILSLQPAIFIPGDYVFRKGDIGTKMYFIVKGSVSVMDEFSGNVFAVLTEGNFFGEVALLNSVPRNATVVADDYCDMYTLDKKTFDEILDRYPTFAIEIKEKARERR